ncbi:MAG: PEP-CTERM-box response regulator transcription factor [Verrucomicrobia bacterium 13_2_20CM_54_12]|nr:MAG: PEP-CTERM-box response regulator transcription factor [Verrucomicrobia bacterium 13_2_20CM_54_12]OLD73822.1 MAG: PEP-CTERM-box response regulator transcription factor [Verrucomicrobia bacterium 13_1_20CM_54_28]OLD87291.1 MAG: PEP-CTERM-box response regulator transcription factor [Verrucomicrobia bacterium 13_1_20CM_4_54_11]
MKPKLLIVDDDEAIRTQMKWALGEDYEVHFAEDRKAAVESFEAHSPAVTLLDLGLPPCPNECDEGLAVLSDILAIDNTAKVIIISGQGEKHNAIQAVGAGAYDFLCKPVEMEELRLLIRRCIHVMELEKEYHKLQQSQRSDVFENMLGTSPQMQAVFAFIRKVAGTNAPVLLLGESGTGKEMAAAAIHHRSTRKDGPFVAINCNAIPENLLESELFGHEKGSFTGAHIQRKGLLETASGGTLFLDEIGELPPAIQVKLLRFLQEQRLQRVGGRQELQVDTRLVAATNADLKGLINNGKFREDLYFRLAVVTIRLLPLRERGEDIVFLAREFLQRYGSQNGRTRMVFAPDALRAMSCYSWPGNVRELQNRVKRGVIMTSGSRVTAKDLELERDRGVVSSAATTLRQAREHVEREMVEQALKKNSGKITSAAAELGISRPTLYELMEKLGISKERAATNINLH